MRESVIYQEIQQEAKQLGREEGIQEGLQREATLVLRLLTRRVGQLALRGMIADSAAPSCSVGRVRGSIARFFGSCARTMLNQQHTNRLNCVVESYQSFCNHSQTA